MSTACSQGPMRILALVATGIKRIRKIRIRFVMVSYASAIING
jgi:hypothetical protein